MYHENQQTLQNTAALEFTLLRMSIETGNIDFIKNRLCHGRITFSGICPLITAHYTPPPSQKKVN